MVLVSFPRPRRDVFPAVASRRLPAGLVLTAAPPDDLSQPSTHSRAAQKQRWRLHLADVNHNKNRASRLLLCYYLLLRSERTNSLKTGASKLATLRRKKQTNVMMLALVRADKQWTKCTNLRGP